LVVEKKKKKERKKERKKKRMITAFGRNIKMIIEWN